MLEIFLFIVSYQRKKYCHFKIIADVGSIISTEVEKNGLILFIILTNSKNFTE